MPDKVSQTESAFSSPDTAVSDSGVSGVSGVSRVSGQTGLSIIPGHPGSFSSVGSLRLVFSKEWMNERGNKNEQAAASQAAGDAVQGYLNEGKTAAQIEEEMAESSAGRISVVDTSKSSEVSVGPLRIVFFGSLADLKPQMGYIRQAERRIREGKLTPDKIAEGLNAQGALRRAGCIEATVAPETEVPTGPKISAEGR